MKRIATILGISLLIHAIPSEADARSAMGRGVARGHSNANTHAETSRGSGLFSGLFGSSTNREEARRSRPAPRATHGTRRTQSSSPRTGRNLFQQLFEGSAQRQRRQQLVVRTTAYTHTEADHIEYGRATATGTTLQAQQNYTSAASDWSRFPVGTKFRIVGYSTVFVIDDYGSALVGTDTIDIYRPDRSQMNQWGVRNLEIEIIEEGCFETSREILGSRLAHDHCREMYSSIRA